MKEILITSSVLICLLLILRSLFRKTISRRLQYALWGLVLLRLLVPINLPAISHNALTVAETVTESVAEQFQHITVHVRPIVQGDPAQNAPQQPDPAALPVEILDKPAENAPVQEQTEHADRITENGTPGSRTHTASEWLHGIWLLGMAVIGGWILLSNLRFWLHLRKVRVPYSTDEERIPTYLVEQGLSSPCLFGLLRPAVYLTPEAVQSEERLRHVLAHEQTHARHLDALWSTLRCVCLTIYWFDPLVWAAAIVSKTDCELACDEGALKCLGEEERIAYGRTLLSLIPVRNGVENPVLSATTMSSGKRRLKERITRIAENRQTVTAALFLVLAAVALIFVATFTGSDTQKQPGRTSGGQTSFADGPISGEELRYFNQVFFNNDTFDSIVGLNIHNQFLGSIYEAPQDIDLFELFYCGTGIAETMTEEERQAYSSLDPDGLEICPTDKLSTGAMDQVLRSNTGIGLDETAHIGLEKFQYSEEEDAYYHSHGDTNYFHSVNITAGEREGDLLHLYYQDSVSKYPETDWLCVTLRSLPGNTPGNDTYHFVSNLPAAKPPAIPTVLPEGTPQFTFSLDELEPLKPRPAEVIRASNDCAERGGGFRLDDDISIRSYRSTDGNLYAAIVYQDSAGRDGTLEWEVGRFFQYPKGAEMYTSADLFTFHQFGYSGVAVAYSGEVPGDSTRETTLYDYYAFDQNGTPSFLFRAYGAEHPISIDLDGDGTMELAASEQVFFRRDGHIYEANIRELLTAAWPELHFWDWSWWDTDQKCMTVSGFVEMPAWGGEAMVSAWRDIYFDGENLLVYKTETTTEDHISSSVSRNFPAEVMDQAMEKVEREKDTFITNTGDYDDWRLSNLSLVTGYQPFSEVDLEIYAANWELHPKDPANQMLAGGMYLDENGWVGGIYSEPGPYLVFSVEDGKRTYLGDAICGDCSVNSIAFHTDLCNLLLEQGMLTVSDLDSQELLNLYLIGTASFMNRAATWPESDQTILIDALKSFHHTGRFQEERDLRDAIATTVWCSRDLTEAGRQLFQELLAATGIHGFGTGEIYQDLNTAIHQSLVEYRYNASAHKDDFYEVAYRILGKEQGANTITCYLATCFASYDAADHGYTLDTNGYAPVILSFAANGGQYQLTEYWEPQGGAFYGSDIERNYPGELKQEALSPSPELLETLQQRCTAAAEKFFGS